MRTTLPKLAIAALAAGVAMSVDAQVADDCCAHLGGSVQCPAGLPPGSRSVQFVSGGTNWQTPSGATVFVPATTFPACTPKPPRSRSRRPHRRPRRSHRPPPPPVKPPVPVAPPPVVTPPPTPGAARTGEAASDTGQAADHAGGAAANSDAACLHPRRPDGAPADGAASTAARPAGSRQPRGPGPRAQADPAVQTGRSRRATAASGGRRQDDRRPHPPPWKDAATGSAGTARQRPSRRRRRSSRTRRTSRRRRRLSRSSSAWRAARWKAIASATRSPRIRWRCPRCRKHRATLPSARSRCCCTTARSSTTSRTCRSRRSAFPIEWTRHWKGQVKFEDGGVMGHGWDFAYNKRNT